jgi:hypothetical protein
MTQMETSQTKTQIKSAIIARLSECLKGRPVWIHLREPSLPK